MTTTALVVDDEVDLCRLIQITLTKMGIKSDVAYDADCSDYGTRQYGFGD
jgi:DNA-binding response OmpR family regulator